MVSVCVFSAVPVCLLWQSACSTAFALPAVQCTNLCCTLRPRVPTVSGINIDDTHNLAVCAHRRASNCAGLHVSEVVDVFAEWQEKCGTYDMQLMLLALLEEEHDLPGSSWRVRVSAPPNVLAAVKSRVRAVGLRFISREMWWDWGDGKGHRGGGTGHHNPACSSHGCRDQGILIIAPEQCCGLFLGCRPIMLWLTR